MEKEFFIRNRNAIYEATQADVIVLAGNVAMQSSHDASYRFEQEANFWYLTGLNVAGWWLVIEKEKSYLVAPDVDEVHRIFDGSLLDNEAIAMSGVDDVLKHEAGEALLAYLKQSKATVATIGDDPHQSHYDFSLNPGPVAMFSKLKDMFGEVKDCRHELAQLRAIKSPQEIQLLRDAIQLTVEAFESIKSDIKHYSFEYEIEADFSYHFRKNGASGHAYDPIVASGENACTLHYGKNQDALAAGDFVLIDVGARLKGYPADITRTYAYGELSERQKQVHFQVEKAHHEIIALLRPGLRVNEYFDCVDTIMLAALNQLGLIKQKSDFRKYFPHSISHGLGIDVHDSLGGPEVFWTGMVLTVEPGIYIPEEGIGVRIEDDILITETGHENLSGLLPTSL